MNSPRKKKASKGGATAQQSTEVIAAKKKPKGEITYNIQLNQEQKEAKALIHANTITILTGKAGSGKTLLACHYALDQLFKKEIGKIYITRPTVVREEMGYLPGDIAQKLDPFLIPIYDNLRQIYNRDSKIDELLKEKIIEIAPISYMRGRTFTNSVLIIDEAQNVDDESLKMCLTRLGLNSKIILCGDIAQVDLKSKALSGLKFITTLSGRVNGLTLVDLKTNHRHPILDELLQCYEEYEEAKENRKKERY